MPNDRAELHVLQKIPSRPPKQWFALRRFALKTCWYSKRWGNASSSVAKCHFLRAVRSTQALNKAGTMICPLPFPGVPFLLEDFLSVQGQHDHSPNHSTKHDLNVTRCVQPQRRYWDKAMHYIPSLQIFLTASRICWSQNMVLNTSKLKPLTKDGTGTHQSPLMFNSPELFAERVYLRYYCKKNQEEIVFQSMTDLVIQ